MLVTVWLKVEGRKKYANWSQGKLWVGKSKPACGDKEIAVKLELEIPDSVFEEPVYHARIKLPDTTRQLPDSITLQRELTQSLNEKLGFKIKLSVDEPTTELTL